MNHFTKSSELHIIKTKFFYNKGSPSSVRPYETVDLGMLELTYRSRTFRAYIFSSCQKCPIDFKLGMMIFNKLRYNEESVAIR